MFPQFFLLILFLPHSLTLTFNLLPNPKNLTLPTTPSKLYLSPTQFPLTITPTSQNLPSTESLITQTFNFYKSILNLQYTGRTHIPNVDLIIKIDSMSYPDDFSQLSEEYTLVTTNNSITIQCENYIGYLRGMATLMQLVKHDESSKDSFTYSGIIINDYPDYYHRGLMLDTARHFISVDRIIQQFPAMMISKLNVFHWHITDSDSFPLYLTNLKNLTMGGAFNLQKIYSPEDVQLVIDTARKNGIMVIPEIDAPAHSRSWGLGGPLKGQMVCLDHHLDEPPCGEIDPTLNITYDVAEIILNQLMEQFPTNRVHLGGDEVDFRCWETKPSILAWMNSHNISTYDALQLYFRERERKLLKSGKSAIYWTVDSTFTLYSKDDILQYWGSKSHIKNFTSISNKVILSPYDALYLDVGVGSLYGTGAWFFSNNQLQKNKRANYNSWRNMIDFQPQSGGKNIIGAEATLWSELNTDDVTDQKYWVRSCALADRVWNNQFYIDNYDYNTGNQENVARDLAVRLIKMETYFRDIGMQFSPTTSQYCALHPEICWITDSNNKQRKLKQK